MGKQWGKRWGAKSSTDCSDFPREVRSRSSAAGPRKAVSGCGKRTAVLKMFMGGLKMEWARKCRKCSMIARKCWGATWDRKWWILSGTGQDTSALAEFNYIGESTEWDERWIQPGNLVQRKRVKGLHKTANNVLIRFVWDISIIHTE